MTLTQETDYPGLGAANRVTDYWYDWRDRLVAEKDGVESSENDGVNRPIIVTWYDNLDEVIQTQQYLGDNVTPQIANGVLQPLDPTKLRAEEDDSYDEQGRVYQTYVDDVNPSSGVVSGALVTNYYYDHRGDLIAESDPGGLWTKSVYDGGGRDVLDYTTDGSGGTTWTAAGSVANDTVLEQEQTIYDGDGNAIETIDSQRFHNATGLGPLGTPTSGIGARVYYAADYYDNADRLIASVDAGTNGGTTWTRPGSVPASSPTLLVTQYAYNAAGLVQDTLDPMGIDTRTLYDNLGRTTETIDDYTGNPETAESDVATEYGYDGDNNVIYVRADEPGGSSQQTDYVYGVSMSAGSGVNSNDILSAIQYPDPITGQPSSSQQDSYLVNALGQVVSYTDRNGNFHHYSYDVLGRLTLDWVMGLGGGVSGTVRQIGYSYDGQGNLSLITSLGANGNIVNQVKDVYNGLGQLTNDYQSHSGAVNGGTPQVQYAYNEMSYGENNSRLVSMTYPNGYTLNYNYSGILNDSISRLSSLSDSSGTLESYLYLGLNTVVETDHPFVSGGSLNLSYIKQSGDPYANSDGGDQYTGLDRFGRVIDQNWFSTGSQSPGTMDRYQYGYNADSEVLYRLNLMDPGTQQNAGMSELYSYDNLGQLTSFQRGTLNSSDNGILGAASRSQSWTPDALGNSTSVSTNNNTQTRAANQQNEYTSISGSIFSPSYDADGNLTADSSGNVYIYDAWNRLVAVKNNNSLVASYSYDGLNRQIEVTENYATTDLYYSSSDQVLAEYQNGTETAYNVWSVVYVNALVLRNVNEGSHWQPFYVVQDANWNVTALVNATGGVVVERYAYDPYGAESVLQPNWQSEGGGVYGVPFGFQGMWFDWTVGLNFTRGREYDPVLMRWLQTDPLGLNAGNNDYAFVNDEPTNLVDPSGLASIRRVDLGNGKVGLFYMAAPLNRPVFGEYRGKYIGVLDTSTNLVTRGGYSVDLATVEGEVNGWTTTSDWAGWFKENAADLDPTRAKNMAIAMGTFQSSRNDFAAGTVVMKDLAWQSTLHTAGAGLNASPSRFAGGFPKGSVTTPAGGVPGFDTAGRLARNGTRPAYAQSTFNTCGPTSVGMVLDTVNGGRNTTNLVNLQLTVRGTRMDRLVALLRANGTNATLRSGASIGDIAAATARGNPLIAHVNLPGGGGHFLVIDGVTTRMGQQVVAIRDPDGGRQYFELASEFWKRFSGWVVTVP